jgi:hypothetical protein
MGRIKGLPDLQICLRQEIPRQAFPTPATPFRFTQRGIAYTIAKKFQKK